jgi:hypothetical protein
MSTVAAESYPAIIGGEKVDAAPTFEDRIHPPDNPARRWRGVARVRSTRR